MSLISEALKKAQRARTSESAAPSSGGGISRHSRSPATQPIVWVVAGAAVVVSLAVVTTVFLLRPAAPALSLAKAAAAPAAANTASATTASPVVAAPIVTPAPKSPEPVPDIVATAPKPAAPPSPASRPTTTSSSSGRLPPSVPLPVPAGDARPDLRIQTFVDAIKVAGIRSSGAESKVLMNDHVYRMNDIVDRSLNLRLVDVQTDSLTFVDENNVVYVKNF
jgi:hypothetical protein